MKRVFDSSQFVLCVLFFVIAAVAKVCGSEYSISFTASGASNTLDYVVVQNLTRGTTVTVPAGNYLHVSDVTGMNQLNAQVDVCFTIFIVFSYFDFCVIAEEFANSTSCIFINSVKTKCKMTTACWCYIHRSTCNLVNVRH